MIQLTPTQTRVNKKGEEVDATIYLDRLDSNNIVLKEGDTVLNYFGDARTALSRALNYALKGSSVHFDIENIIATVKHMDEAICSVKKSEVL